MRVTRSVTSKFFDNVTTNYDAFRSASSMFVPFLFEPILWISARRKNGLAASPSTKTRFRRSLYSAKRSIRFLSRQSNIFLLCTTGNITDFFIFFSFASLSLSLFLACDSSSRFTSISITPPFSSILFCVFLPAEVAHSRSTVARHHRKSRFFARYFALLRIRETSSSSD